MKLAYPQLVPHLAKSLAPLYLISSDELLLVQEAIDAIRHAAEQAGFSERIAITAESSKDVEKLLYEEAHGLSLFASKRIIELNLSHIKMTQAIGKTLETYAQNPLNDTLLIIHTNKLDSQYEKSAWYKTIEKQSITVPIWPIPAEQLPSWIMQRAKKSQLTLTKLAAEWLATQVEGNLLAAAQEIEKLSLLTQDTIDHHTIQAIVTDHARFDIFNLVDNALLGHRKRSLHILQHLAAEAIEPTLILWALTREIRTLADILKQMQQGIPLATLFSQFRIWDKRKSCVQACIQRHSVTHCWHWLRQSAKIDRIIKGIEVGNPWDALEDLTLSIASHGIIKHIPSLV